MGGCLASLHSAPTPREGEAGEASPPARPPKCVAFQSQPRSGERKYFLCYDAGRGDADAKARRGSIRLNGEGIASPYTRFYMDPSGKHAGLVHVRCCYDNKYWVAKQRRPGDGGSWAIVGAADEAEEDLSKLTCTLFRVTHAPPRSIRLLHVHMEKYVCLPSSSDVATTVEAARLSTIEGDVDDAVTTFTIHDLSQQVVLPRYLAFKGDNGMYLRQRIQERHEYLQFSGHGIRDEGVVNTIEANDDGTFRVQSSHTGKFWRRSPNWIWVDSDGGVTDSGSNDTLFRAIRLPSGAAFFALQSLGNGYFCKRLTTEGKRNCLNAGTPTITAETRLQLEEAVISRKICNVVFDLSQPRIYGKSVVTMAAASALNGTTSNNTEELALEYTNTEKRTWSSSVTLKLDGVATTICTGIPVVAADGCVAVSAEFSGSYSWGSAVEEKNSETVDYEVAVPPKTRVKVTLTATRASCDVPFSYMQRDTLVDGRVVTYDMDDGLYTCVNCYELKYVTSEESIDIAHTE